MHNIEEFLNSFSLPDGWNVVRVLRSGEEELMASGLSLVEAQKLADQILKRRVPGVTVSLRESFKAGF